jgi:hypothetical protein
MGVVVMKDQVMLGYGSFKFPFHAEDPAYQNSREYMGYLGGLLLLIQITQSIPHDAFTLHWVGDNTSALSWAEAYKVASSGTQAAFMAVSWLTISQNIQLIETEHLAGRLMGCVDALSRRQKHDLPPSLEVNLDSQSRWHELFVLCDQTVKHNLAAHHEVLHRVVQALRNWPC